MVTKLSRKSLRALAKPGHHNVPGKNQEVARVVHSARLCVTSLHFPLGHMWNDHLNSPVVHKLASTHLTKCPLSLDVNPSHAAADTGLEGRVLVWPSSPPPNPKLV